jgi:hypothetical protein
VLLFNNKKDKFVLLVKNIFQILCCSEHVTELIECCWQSCCFKTMTLEGHFDGKWPFDDISIKMPITEQHKIKKSHFFQKYFYHIFTIFCAVTKESILIFCVAQGNNNITKNNCLKVFYILWCYRIIFKMKECC